MFRWLFGSGSDEEQLLRLLENNPNLRAALNAAATSALNDASQAQATSTTTTPPPMTAAASAAATPAPAPAPSDANNGQLTQAMIDLLSTPVGMARTTMPVGSPSQQRGVRFLPPAVSQDPSVDTNTATLPPSLSPAVLANRRYGPGKYLWDARMSAGRNRKSNKVVSSVRAVPIEGQIVTRTDYHGNRDPLLSFHFIYGHSVDEMTAFLAFLAAVMEENEVLTIRRLSEIFEMYISAVWSLNNWDPAHVPLPPFYRDDDDDDDSNGSPGKRRATRSSAAPAVKRPARA